MKKFLCLMLAFVIVLAGGTVLAASDDTIVIRNRKAEVFENIYAEYDLSTETAIISYEFIKEK